MNGVDGQYFPMFRNGIWNILNMCLFAVYSSSMAKDSLSGTGKLKTGNDCPAAGVRYLSIQVTGQPQSGSHPQFHPIQADSDYQADRQVAGK